MNFAPPCPALAVAALCCNLSACSEPVTRETARDPARDAAMDAEPTSWLVHVAVVGATEAIPVLVSEPDGSIHSVTQTDAGGKLDVEVPHLGSVSVFTRDEDNESGVTLRAIRTQASVDANMTFRTSPADVSFTPKLDKVTFVPTGPLPTGTDHVRISLPCGGYAENAGDPSGAISFETFSSCEGATQYFAVGWAMDSSNEPLAATVVDELPVGPGPVTYDVDFSTSQPFALFHPDVLEPTADVSELYVRVVGLVDSGGMLMRMEESFDLKPPISIPAIPMLTSYFPNFEIAVLLTLVPTDASPFPHGSSRFLRATALPSSFVLDPNSLAPIESVSPIDVTDPARPKLTFSIVPGGTQGNCVSANLVWSNSDFEPVVWSSFSGFQQGAAFQVPELPPSLSDMRPDSDSEFYEWGTSVNHVSQDVDCGEHVEFGNLVIARASPKAEKR